MPRKYTEAQNRATQKYAKANYDSISIKVPKGKREEFSQIAAAAGKSLTQYIIDCFDKSNDE